MQEAEPARIVFEYQSPEDDFIKSLISEKSFGRVAAITEGNKLQYFAINNDHSIEQKENYRSSSVLYTAKIVAETEQGINVLLSEKDIPVF